MTTQPSFVNPVLLQELSESFRLHNQIPSDLYTRFRIKRGLRNADGTGVLVGASRLGNGSRLHTQRGRARADRGPPDLPRL